MQLAWSETFPARWWSFPAAVTRSLQPGDQVEDVYLVNEDVCVAWRSLGLTANELTQTDKCKSQEEPHEAIRQMYTAGVCPGTDVFLCWQLKPLSPGWYRDVRTRWGFSKHRIILLSLNIHSTDTLWPLMTCLCVSATRTAAGESVSWHFLAFRCWQTWPKAADVLVFSCVRRKKPL